MLSTTTNQVETETEQQQSFSVSRKIFPGRIHHERVTVARDAQVSDILKQLEVNAGLNGSFLTLNNQLSQLQEDDRLRQEVIASIFIPGKYIS